VEPITIYTAYTLDEAQKRQEELAMYREAHDAYMSVDFDKARKLFVELESTGAEPILCKIYIERCDLLIDNPPEYDWDGVFTHKTK